MYVSPVTSTTNFGYAKPLTKANKLINRSSLQKVSSLNDLRGYAEKEKAKSWVAAYSVGNGAAAATFAQAGGLEELLLSGVEVVMAAHILNGIYDFKLSKNALKIIGTGIAGHKIGLSTFKWASKSVTWIPLVGNALNAVVAGSTTAALGAALIQTAEFMDEQRQKGKTMDEIMKKLQEFIKKLGQ